MAGYEVGSAYLTILPSTKGFASNLNKDLDAPFSQAGMRGGDQIGDGVGKSKGFAKAGLVAGGAFLASFAAVGISQAADAVKDFLTDAISSASDLNETTSKTEQIFGDAASKVLKFSKTTSTALGQSQQEALDGAATFGIFGKSAGLTGDNLSDFSTGLVGLAGDLASFNNTSPEDAINAIGSALRGEAEPIRAYGVLLDDATLKNRALAMGLISSTKDALTPANKVLAAQQEILAQTSDAQGDFARTSGGLANQQRIFTAELENTKATIGTALLPVVTDLFHTFSDVGVPALQDLAAWVTENQDVIKTTAIAFVAGGLSITSALLKVGAMWFQLQGAILTGGQFMVDAFLYVVQRFVDGAAEAFGWIPGIGPKIQQASDNLRTFGATTDETFSAMRAGADKTAQTFYAGADAVDSLRDKVLALNGASATVSLNAQGNLVTAFQDGTFRVAGGGVKFRASGGPVSAGQPYVVGENSPELFVPDRPGHIYNQQQLAAMGSSSTGSAAGVTNWHIYENATPEATAQAVARRQNMRMP